jgi:uncharacterized protein YdaU (DUF1376 family)
MVKADELFMRVYINRILGASEYLEMTAAQRGAYCTLLFVCFQSGGRLPANARALQVQSKCSADEWDATSGDLVCQQFVPMKDQPEYLTHPLVLSEVEHMRSVSGARSVAAKARYSTLDANAEQVQTKSTANAVQNRIEKKRIEESKEGKAKALPMPIPTVEEVRAYMAEQGWADPDYMAAKVHAHYELNKWAMSSGKKLKSWKHAVDNTWDESKYKLRPNPNGQAKLNEPRNTVPRGLPKMI